MLAGPDSGSSIDLGFKEQSPELRYLVEFATPGTYYVWLRGWADKAEDASVHVGIGRLLGILWIESREDDDQSVWTMGVVQRHAG